MIKRIVVPVDQTEEAKTALNIAVWLSLLFEARLLLLGISDREPRVLRQVHPAHRDGIPSETPDRFREQFEELWTYPIYFSEASDEPVEIITFNSDEEQALEAYLSNLQKKITGSYLHHKLPPGQVSQRIDNGPLDQALKDLDAEESIDLVVLAARQESRLKQHLVSSQPNQILRQARIPVLVVPKGFKISSLKQFENETLMVNSKLFLKPTKGHIVVTLDGTNQAEAALPLAGELAKKMNVSLYLLLVIPMDTRKTYTNPQTSQVFKPDSDRIDQYDFAYNYLCRIQQGLIDDGINCHRIILEGKAEERIAKFIERTRPTLTILATHANPKLGQILLGSIAEKVLKTSSRLVLLVPNTFQSQPDTILEEDVVEREEIVGSSS
jgi:nucleotide-binding universal stress UspA family protein